MQRLESASRRQRYAMARAQTLTLQPTPLDPDALLTPADELLLVGYYLE